MRAHGTWAAAAIVWILTLTGCPLAPPPAPSVILVTLDTTRWDRFGAYGDPEARTPEFDARARAGALFRAAFVDAPTTLPSHATMMTGAISPRHGVRLNGAYSLPASARTLAEVFAEHGYSRAAVVSSAALASTYGLDQGFTEFDDAMPDFYEAYDRVWSIRARRVAGNQRRAYQTNEAARAILARLESPAFLWVHYIDAHQPDDPPFPWNRIPGLAPYSAEIAYVDRHMGLLLREAEEALGESVVAMLADHGESSGEHRDYGHALFLYDATVRIPFAVTGPDIAERIVLETVTNADVSPILLAAAGLPGEKFPDGTDRLAANSTEPEAIYSETLAPTQAFGGAPLKSLRTGGWKYVHAPRPELYDLSEDPREIRNLHGVDPESDARFRTALESFVRDVTEGTEGSRAEVLGVDAERREALGALGYLVTGAPPDPEDPLSTEGVDPKDIVDVFWALRYIDDGLIDDARPGMERFWREHGRAAGAQWSPLLARAHYCQAVLDYVDERPDAARERIRRAIELDAGFRDPHLLLQRMK